MSRSALVGFAAALALTLGALLLLAGCARAYGDTDEFRAFKKIIDQREAVSRTEAAEGVAYVLEEGRLAFVDEEAGEEIWRSDEYWQVDDFRLFDVDGDGHTDCLFSVWKSYSYYEGYDENDDPSVKNHLFLYTVRGGHAKALWASSNLPRPIYGFEVSEGTPTPAASGTVLKTTEGEYTEDYTQSGQREFTYTWQGWGFVRG